MCVPCLWRDETSMATMYLLLMLSRKLFTIMRLVITKTVAQEQYSVFICHYLTPNSI